jgi:hypothetical protein
VKRKDLWLTSTQHHTIRKHTEENPSREKQLARTFRFPFSYKTKDITHSCFFLSCKANARVKLAKIGHGQHSSKCGVRVVLFIIRVVLLLIVLFYVLFVCKCVLYHCHLVSTQLQLTNISYIVYHISPLPIFSNTDGGYETLYSII